MKRLLSSLNNADYHTDDVPLIISIDCSGNTALYEYVNSFAWNHGDKYVVIHQERLGLKEHIFSCGDFTKYFKAVVLLEDDIFVSPYYYDYIVPIYNDKNLDDVLMKLGYKIDQKHKTSSYTKIFPGKNGDYESFKQLKENIKKSKNSNLIELLEYLDSCVEFQ